MSLGSVYRRVLEGSGEGSGEGGGDGGGGEEEMMMKYYEY